ncbi:MAG: hypothetical protein ACFFFB_07755, partial [Candidatus Heimdallarchaeota archaeon]
MDFLIITSSEDIASMNIRDKLLNSESFVFEEINHKWKGNTVLKLDKNENLDSKNINVYLGITDERMIFLNDLELQDLV